MKILGTGLTGLVGSRIVELLKDGYEFEVSDIDITDRHRIFERIESSDASMVLHLAAKTNVDECEENHSSAWEVNVVGTKNIADACQKSNKKLIYISTDFVFDGSKEIYSEEDSPNPINWYAKTKLEGEKIVQGLSSPWAIARLAYPYRASFERMDFVRAILQRLQKKEVVKAVDDQIFTPTFIDDVAFAIDLLMKKEATGTFHVVGSEFISPYDAVSKIADVFGLNADRVSKTTRLEYFRNRAPRPFRLVLKNDKIQELGVRMRGFGEGLKELKSQMSNLKSASEI